MSETSKRLTLSELQETPEYQKLTQKQKLFVATYCQGGLTDGTYDAIGATRTAYQCKSAETARIMSYSLLQNIRIVAALNRHFNTQPIEQFMVMLDRAINNKNLTLAQLHALKLKSDLMGFGTRIPINGTCVDALNPVRPPQKTSKKEPKSKKNSGPSALPPKDSSYGF